ncbi:hypothetical protein KUL152_08440 [Tenacibaculum sp. KUL152]|nr:hypothetical protein KUL152_08440 [Tenacibaculum sp. KUL152]
MNTVLPNVQNANSSTYHGIPHKTFHMQQITLTNLSINKQEVKTCYSIMMKKRLISSGVNIDDEV